MALTLKQRVRQGIALLNKRLPGWKSEIDPHALDMAIPGLCILGQLFGQYDKGKNILRVPKPSQYGFEATGDVTYDELRREWLRKLGYSEEMIENSA